MKKTEKIISALFTITLGVLLITLRGRFISILMTVLGLGLIAFAVIDLFNRLIPPAVVKAVVGIVIILCGWTIIKAVLYVLGAILLVVGILLLYEKIKTRVRCATLWQTICQYAVPVLCFIIGLLFLFNQGNTIEWVFILSGILTIIEGGLVLATAVTED
ncbi:MAG: hypothetical protein E7381_00595 [Clostridiales bacterium]|nr:hypothetical protein [Clostridiales bacterium]